MKSALCVGINDYPVRGMDLKGCVNDAKAWAALLVDHFGFRAGQRHGAARRPGDEAGASSTGSTSSSRTAKRGDVLVFTNSSHGTYVADANGDETRYDEAMCPYDMKKYLIVDDELRERFAAMPAGVRLTVVSDSCFSGSVTRGDRADAGRPPAAVRQPVGDRAARDRRRPPEGGAAIGGDAPGVEDARGPRHGLP